MGYSSGKLPNGLKFLRLPQLALHGPQLSDVESHGHNAAIAPPPFGFDAFHLATFAARSH